MAGGGSPAAQTGHRPSSAGPPVVVPDAHDARVAVHDGRVSRSLVFDGGALHVDPAEGDPHLDEAGAIKVLRAAAPPGSSITVTDVVIGLGTVTLATPVTNDGDLITPKNGPEFRNRQAWVVLYENIAHSCPMMPARPTGATPPDLREPLPVVLLAADDSGEGVSYAGRGSFCGGPAMGPAAHPRRMAVSLPWQV